MPKIFIDLASYCNMQDIEKEILCEKYRHKRIVSLWLSFRDLNKDLDYAFKVGNYDGFYDNLTESIFVFQKIDKRTCLKKVNFWDFLEYCAEKYRINGNQKTANLLEEELRIFDALCIH